LSYVANDRKTPRPSFFSFFYLFIAFYYILLKKIYFMYQDCVNLIEKKKISMYINPRVQFDMIE